ncbi:hypothetical protein SO694_00060238 [Aureococcus anophagefferens]|uniref:Zinc finger PHD-type domain-containing protein n=1 Tax=Aureococcus anophagefferens TaxID=44056 RepID=A0ABR1FRC4_AURAN
MCFLLGRVPGVLAFARSVGARVDLEALPAWDADAGDDLCPALPACAASCCACPHGPAFDALAAARARRSASAAVWNLLACESCGVSYAHAGCLAKRRRGGFVCGLCESGDDDGARPRARPRVARRRASGAAPPLAAPRRAPAAGALALAAAEDARAPAGRPRNRRRRRARPRRRAVPAPAPRARRARAAGGRRRARRARPAHPRRAGEPEEGRLQERAALRRLQVRVGGAREVSSFGTRADLRHDIALGYVVVVDRAPTPPPRAQRATALPSFVKSCPAYLGRAARGARSRARAPGIPNGDPAPGWHKEIIPRKHDPREADVHFYDARSGRQFRSLASLRARRARRRRPRRLRLPPRGRPRALPAGARAERDQRRAPGDAGAASRSGSRRGARRAGRDVPPHPTATVRAAEAAVDRTGGTAEQRAFASLMAAVYSHNKTY